MRALCLIGDAEFLLLMALWITFVSLLGVLVGYYVARRR